MRYGTLKIRLLLTFIIIKIMIINRFSSAFILHQDAIDEFRPMIPIIQAVRNPGMKERHWNEFMEKSGKTV